MVREKQRKKNKLKGKVKRKGKEIKISSKQCKGEDAEQIKKEVSTSRKSNKKWNNQENFFKKKEIHHLCLQSGLNDEEKILQLLLSLQLLFLELILFFEDCLSPSYDPANNTAIIWKLVRGTPSRWRHGDRFKNSMSFPCGSRRASGRRARVSSRRLGGVVDY